MNRILHWNNAEQSEYKDQWEQLQRKLDENEVELRRRMEQCTLRAMLGKEKSLDFVNLLDRIDKLRTERTNLIFDEISLKAKMDSKPVYRSPTRLLPKDDYLTRSDEFNRRFQTFIYDHQDVCKKFAMLRFYEESREFLHRHQYIVCTEASYFLQLWGMIQLMEKNKKLANVVAHQAACMEYILELGRIEDVQPCCCVNMFFNMIQRCTPHFKSAFLGDIRYLFKCLKSNARYNAARNREALAETARKARLCPNGIDPYDELDKLPKNLRDAFQNQDVALLKQSLSSLDPEVALKHLKSCINVGIWLPHEKKDDILEENDVRFALSIFLDKEEEPDSSDEEDDYNAEGNHREERLLTATHNQNLNEVKIEKTIEINHNFLTNLKTSETTNEEMMNRILMNVLYSDVFFENVARQRFFH